MMQLSVYKEHYKETIRLGVPIMLGQLGIIVVGFADNIMVGHHSTAELAAASFVNNFFNLVFIAGMGFSYGLTPIIGGYFAQKEYAKAGETLKNSLCINLIVGLLLSLCMLTLLLNIHILKQPEELMPYIVPYYILQLFSVIFAMLFNSFKQFSDGTTDTVTPMCVMLGANVLNIIGNYLLIYGNFGCPELGLTGAGISTLASRILTFGIFCVLFAKHSRYKLYREGFKKGTVNRANIGNLVRLGLPVGFQMGVETGSFSLSVIMMGWLGSTASGHGDGSHRCSPDRDFPQHHGIYHHSGKRGGRTGRPARLVSDPVSGRRRAANPFRQRSARHLGCQIHGLYGFLLPLRTGTSHRLPVRVHFWLGSHRHLVRLPDQPDHARTVTLETFQSIDNKKIGYD